MAKTEYDRQREVEFREIARDIVARDREKRKYGLPVDTAGTIRRALESAYQRGKKEEVEGTPKIVKSKREKAIVWNLLPPKPRTAFWSICLVILGNLDYPNQEIDDYGIVKEFNARKGKEEWVICRFIGGEKVKKKDSAWGDATIKPLIARGLLGPFLTHENVYKITEVGTETWWEANEQSKVAGSSHFFP